MECLPASWHKVALDLAGHGHSDHRPKGVIYHLVDAVDDTMRVVDSLGWKEFYLVGHSLGGGIATLIAGSFPKRVKKLVLLEAIGPLGFAPEDTAAKLAQYYAASQEAKKKRMPVYPDLDQAVRARLQAGGLTPASARLISERGTKKVEGGITWRSDPRLRLPSISRFTESQIQDFLSHIECPTLAVFTEQGLVLAHPWEKRAERIGGLKVERLAGMHHLHVDDAKKVAPLIEKHF